MSDILKNCAVTFLAAKNAQSCNTPYLAKAKRVVLWAYGTEITAVGDSPTAAEIQAFANLFKCVIIDLGLVTQPDGTPINLEADTVQESVTIKIGETKVLTGYVTNLNDKVNKMLSNINTNKKVCQLGWIGADGRFYGGKKGIKAGVSVLEMADNGGGINAIMRRKVELNYQVNQGENLDYTEIDTDYLLIDNAENIGVYTLAGDASKDSISGYEGVTNWDKSLYPTLYAKVDGTDVDYYISAAHRRASTPKYFSINTLVNGNVIAGTGAGLNLGGFVDIISANFAADDEFTVAYS